MRVRLRHRVLARRLAESPLSQNRWAQKMGLTSGHLSQLVNGRRLHPNAATRARLLEALGLTFDELFEIRPERCRRTYPGVAPPVGPDNADPPRLRVHQKGDHMTLSLLSDLRYSIRLLERHPGFMAVATLALALGIGANTAIFSVLEATILRALPFSSPERIVAFWAAGSWSKAEFAAIRQADTALESVAAVAVSERTLLGERDPQLLRGMEVSGDFFTVLGVTPRLGRALSDADTLPGSSRVVILGDGLWRRLGADPDIVGSRLRLDQRDYEVVGVAPAGFYFPHPGTDFWAPLALDPSQRQYRGAFYLNLIGRLSEGASIERANAEIPALAQVMREQFNYRPEFDKFAAGNGLQSLRDQLTGSVRPPLFLLAAAVGLVLLIACVNVANLFLAHVLGRSQEISLRAALGASRLRIVRQILVESLTLGVAGGAAGVVLALAGVALLASRLPAEFANFPAVEVNWTVLSFAVGASLLAGLLAGVVPALRATGNLSSSLGDARRSGPQLSHRTGGALVVAEVALAVVLVAGAGLTLRSFWALTQVNPGFNAGRLTTLSVLLPAAAYRTSAHRVAFVHEVTASLGGVAGVEEVGGIHVLPIGGSGWTTPIIIEGLSEKFGDLPGSMLYRLVAGRYFETMGVGVVTGRGLNPADNVNAEPVCVINERMAAMFWPETDPIGQRIRTGPDGSQWLRIVGVVGNVKSTTLDREAEPAVYRPYAQSGSWPRIALVLRSALSAEALLGPAREAIWAVDPDVPVFAESSMQQVIDRSLGEARLLATLLTAFGVAALCLGAVGIYGIVSYRVSQTRYEMGVRLALGAQSRQVAGLVLRRGLVLSMVGLAIGLLGALAATRLLAGFLYGISETDPATFGVVAVTVAGVAAIAGWIPARRASRLDPVVTLRGDV